MSAGRKEGGLLGCQVGKRVGRQAGRQWVGVQLNKQAGSG